MVAELIHTVSSLAAAHPHWIGFAIFAATALESMAFVGSFFPGMSMVIALSGIAAALGANVWILVLWCTFGAIVGDGVSFWIGHRFGGQLKSTWPFRTRPELLDKGVEFFRHNGAKSIVVGRFLPFTRAVVPIAAGMLGMNPVRFYVANILSAIGWAFVNVVPAAGLGLAFAGINETSTRLAAMLGAFLAIFLAALAAGHVTARLLVPSLDAVLARVSKLLSDRSEHAGRLLVFVFGSSRSLATASAVWVFLTLGLAIGFAGVLEDIVTGDPLVRADVALNSLAQGFRSPIGDGIMIVITSMGDMTVVLWASGILLGGLLLFRAWRTSGMVLLVLAATSAFVPLLKWTLHKPRPIDLYSGTEAFSFPSGHAAFTAVLWGLIAVLGSSGLSRNARAVVWAAAFTFSTLVGLSRIYLSAHWPSDVFGGLLFGWAMATVFGLFVERIREPAVRPALVGLVSSVALILIWGIHATAAFDYNTARYAPRERVVALSLANWLESGWKDISPVRIDLKGEFEEPLLLQAVVPDADIENALRGAGWSLTPVMQWHQARQFFEGKEELNALIPLPLLHNGIPASLTLTRPDAAGGRRDVLRFWHTNIQIEDLPGRPIVLVGSVTQERVVHPFAGINILRDQPAPPGTIKALIASLEAVPSLRLRPPPIPDKTAPWLALPRDIRPDAADGPSHLRDR